MSFPAEALSCETIEGNPDFYGLGIRIGVYLQWITAWISLLVDPLSAQSVYDVNSVFVFAILVATMIATLADNPTIQPIETYIMLQFALGFFVTTLSTFGLRLHFLRPASVAQLGQHLKGFEGAVRESIRNSRSLSLWFGLFGGRVILPLNFFSPLKPYHLSWSGVFWRTATACMLTALNIWLWFASQPNFQLPGQNCDPPFIFFFSRQQLSGPMVGFCKAVSILIAIVVFPPFLILLQLTMRIFQQTLMALYRDMFQSFAPQVSQRLRQPLTRIDSSFSNLDPVTRFSDVLKLIVYLGRGKVEEQREHDAQADNRIILTWNSAE
ncbi:hypothetical protein F4804DRAFT_300828 [Jackrogersella minutella]|nr:hypothetical protein F4804DRAFT_300828 [Jackrogersella minutella]